LINIENFASDMPWRGFPGRAAASGIFQSPSSTGMFPLRFDSPIKKARWLNQKDTKVKTSARAETSAEKESRHSKKQHGALTERRMQDLCTMKHENDLL
jgi:hypothetical protein